MSASLERQIGQLKRLNSIRGPWRLSATSAAEAFAGYVASVLDTSFGAAWIVRRGDAAPVDFAAVGVTVDPREWSALGDALLRQSAESGPVDIDSLLPSADVSGATVAVSRTPSGTADVVLMAANSAMDVADVEVLALLADRCSESVDIHVDLQAAAAQVGRLQESQERLDLVLRGTNDGWWDWDLRTGKCIVSARWLEMLDYEPVSIVRDDFWHEDIHDDDRLAFGWSLERALTGEVPSVESEVRLRRRSGDYLPVLVRGTVTRETDGTAVRFAGSVLDLSERKLYEAHVHQLAFYDVLTELPNRRLLLDRIGQVLLTQSRSGMLSAVLMIDLDRFKVINDTHGHAAGDSLLRAVASRLRRTVRAHDTVARLGGDEFVVLLEDLGTTPEEAIPLAERLAQKVLDAINEPYHLDVGIAQHSASIGVALTDDPTAASDVFLRRADVALYEAKAAGRNAVKLFHEEMQDRVDKRSEMESHLRDALAANELQLFYQPQVALDGTLYGAEALMRWRSADGTTVSPAVFIPVAEESGQIHALGVWSMSEAFRQAALWKPSAPPGFRVAVNVSAPEFVQPDFTQRLLTALDESGAQASDIRLEITEANVVSDLEFAAERMEQLRHMGFEFALDDFGTGYSSLTYLRRLPVSEVKIDRSYVVRFMHNRHDAAILRAIFMLCSSLDIQVVAEGVETEQQRDVLSEMGCRVFQGYLFGAACAPTPEVGGLLLAQGPMLPRRRPEPSAAGTPSSD